MPEPKTTEESYNVVGAGLQNKAGYVSRGGRRYMAFLKFLFEIHVRFSIVQLNNDSVSEIKYCYTYSSVYIVDVYFCVKCFGSLNESIEQHRNPGYCLSYGHIVMLAVVILL